MKKLICLLLCLTLLFSAMPLHAFASELDDDDDIGLDSIPLFDNSVDGRLKRIENDLYLIMKDMSVQRQLAEQIDIFAGLMSGVRSINTIMTLVSNVTKMLELFGVIKSAQQQQMEVLNNIYDVVVDIQREVNEINIKTDKIQNSLNTEFSKNQYNFNLNRYDSYQKAWSDFFGQSGSVAKLKEYYNDYKSEINSDLAAYAESWMEENVNGLRALYTDDFVTVTASGKSLSSPGAALPSAPAKADDGSRITASITLPGSYINVENCVVNTDNVMDCIYEAITEGIDKAIADKKLLTSGPDFYEAYEAKSDSEKSEFKKQIADNLMDSLLYEVSFEAANTKVGVGTFATKVATAYDTFCDTLFGRNNVTSPIYAGIQRLVLTNAFEGEAKEEAAELCFYLSELSMLYGSFATYVTAMDSSMSSSEKEEVASQGRDCALIPLEYYNNFITGNDNYCYPLGITVEYHEVQATSHFDVTSNDRTWSQSFKKGDWSLVDLTLRYDEYGTEEYEQQVNESTAALKATSVSTSDVAILYLYYLKAASESEDSITFMDYLESYNVVKPNGIVFTGQHKRSYPDNIISGSIVQKQLDKKTVTRLTAQDVVYVDEEYESKRVYDWKDNPDSIWKGYFGSEHDIVYSELYDIFKGGFKAYDCVVADSFNVSGTGGSKSLGTEVDSRAQSNATVCARAVYECETNFFRYGEYVYSDGEYTHEHSKPTSKTTLHHLTFTKNFGMIVTSAPAETNRTASLFGDGNMGIIIIGSAVAVAATAAVICIVCKNKKKKKQAAAE